MCICIKNELCLTDFIKDFHSNWIVPDRYTRIPFFVKKTARKVSFTIITNGLYAFYVNGRALNQQGYTQNIVALDSFFYYQTYNITDLIEEGLNVICISAIKNYKIIDSKRLLLDCNIDYVDGEEAIVTANRGLSSPSPIVMSDWTDPEFDDYLWKPVLKIQERQRRS